MSTLAQPSTHLSSSLSDPLAANRAFTGWYKEHVAFVWRTLRRLGVRSSELPDSVHDVFVVAWRKRQTLDPERPVRPWLFNVAHKVAAAHRRRAWFRLGQPLLESITLDPSLSPERQAEVSSELRFLDAALLKISSRGRAVLVLHDFEDVSMNDVADALQIPLKTAYSRLSAARSALRQELRRKELADLNILPSFLREKGMTR